MEPDASPEAAEAERPSRCPTCGTPYPDGNNGLGCPVCLFRRAFDLESAGDRGRTNDWPPLPDDGRFDHYELAQHEDGTFDELGRGAMGITYRAIDTVLGYAVALKVIDARIASRPDARERFLREARAAARLRHPNVASVFYYGVRKSDGQCFYAMELVEGETLEARVRRDGPLPAPVSLEIVSQVARAMAAAEAQGLVHRDLKPANLMLAHGPELTVKVIDFGLAKVAAADQTDLTQAGFVGTPAFASPEQFAGAGVDVRSDLYSLGVTLWVILTGKAPFRGSWPEVMHQKLHAPLPLEQLNGLPKPMVALLQTLLEKDPARRFQSSAELLKMMPTVTEAMEAKRAFKRQKFAQKRNPRRITLSAIMAPEQSIAVLPFDTLSPGQRNTYFADGVQDEILSNLAKVSQLKVISRTSVMTYRPSNSRDLRSIARALRVANVVEGTVRRDGKRIRITVRLIDARTDQALWSGDYDRDLTEIFAIQSDIATKVAAKLRARLSSGERKNIDQILTDDLEAYDLYLQAKQLFANPPALRVVDEHENLLKAVELLQEATSKDSNFPIAYCLLARAHDELYRLDHNDESRALGDAAVKEAMHLRPDLPEVHIAAAFHLFQCHRNYERARVQIAIAERSLPNSPVALACTAYIDRREGRFEESTTCLQRALCLDPRNPSFIKQLALNYLWVRRDRDFEQTYDQVIILKPEERPLLILEKAFLTLLAKADLKSCQAALRDLPSSMQQDRRIVSWRFAYAVFARDWMMAQNILKENTNKELYFSNAEALVPHRCLQIWLALVQGKVPGIRSDFAAARDKLYRKVKEFPKNSALLSALGLVDAALGRAHEAINEAKSAAEMLPIREDAWDGPRRVYVLAAVYALTNESKLAFEQLDLFVSKRRGIGYGELRLDPVWDRLRGDPRFDRLLSEVAPE
jgi:serine/threonine protein kinase/Flp pilus assembly protein TadD